MTFNSLLKNKNVLYVVSFLALTNVFSYLINNNIDAIIYFILIGYVTTYFSKNMIVILIVPMLLTNFFIGIRFAGNVRREGMANQGAKENSSSKTDENKNTQENEDIVVPKKEDNPSIPDSTIDHSATLQKAYDDLDKLLGTDGINKMSDETKRLAEQQQKIMKNIENMAPLLQNATKMLEGLPLDNIGKIQESLSGFMNKFGKK
jgi:hypothetical protein